jgi:hypothetical protein
MTKIDTRAVMADLAARLWSAYNVAGCIFDEHTGFEFQQIHTPKETVAQATYWYLEEDAFIREEDCLAYMAWFASMQDQIDRLADGKELEVSKILKPSQQVKDFVKGHEPEVFGTMDMIFG